MFATGFTRCAGIMTIIIFFSSCKTVVKEKGQQVSNTWYFSKVVFDEKESPIDPDAEAAKPIILSQQTFIDLRADSSYSAYFGKYEKGRWGIRKEHLVLEPENGLPVALGMKFDNDQLSLHYDVRGATYLFDGYANDDEYAKNDPHVDSLNWWRTRPGHRESDEEIDHRLRNHFQFWERFFMWSAPMENAPGTVQTPSLLNVYDNGFQLVDFSAESYEWKRCFYDTADARKAYNRVYYIFEGGDLDWDKSKGKPMMLANAFRQLEAKLE